LEGEGRSSGAIPRGLSPLHSKRCCALRLKRSTIVPMSWSHSLESERGGWEMDHGAILRLVFSCRVATRRNASSRSCRKSRPSTRVTIVGPGGARTEFRLATNERFKDKNDAWHDRTEWHSVVAWQRLAEIVGEYVRKARSSTSKQGADLELGKTGRVVKENTGQRSSRETSCC